MIKFRWKSLLIDLAFGAYNLFAKNGPRVLTFQSTKPMEVLSEYFDAVWVLTIPRNQQRQEHMRRQLAELPFEFFNGIDGRTLTLQDSRIDPTLAEAKAGRSLVINEYACTLSHLAMYQRMVEENLRRVLIFEDDAIFDTRHSRWVEPILSQLPADWELLYLGYRDGELRGFLREFQEFFGRKKSDEVVSRTVQKGLRTAAGHDFTHAYAVTLAGAKKLLSQAYPVSQTADGLLEERVLAGTITAYATVPKLFVQLEDLGSSIHH